MSLDTEMLGLDCGGIPESELSQAVLTKTKRLKLDSSGLNINSDYPASSGNYTNMTSRTIKYIVIHYVGTNGTALSVAKYFQNSGREASAHYVVGLASEDGQIYQIVDDIDKAWHCGTSGTYYHDECRNTNSIGIETACHNDTSDLTASSLDWYFDDETVDSLVKLTKYLMKKYGVDADHVVRHYDVTHKTCPAMWVHDEAAWEAFKARLTEEDTVSILVTSVAGKAGLSSPDYWLNVLNGDAVAKADYVKGLLTKVCTAAGKTYSLDTVTGLLGLNSPTYWATVIAGTNMPSAEIMLALFKKIDAAMEG